MKQISDFNLNEWLNLLENRHQQEVQLGLERVRQVAKALDLLEVKAKVITVAGTNGKGSTVATLEAIYHSAGYQIASFTSPHLLVFNERIKINQKPVSDKDLCKAFFFIEKGRGTIDLTYFEMTTLAALWHFKQQKLDLVILEVGLGGRLDATNIIDSDLAIITTIDLDHQEYLGSTKEAIGFEKAGILRANKPFVYADKNPPNSIIEQASALSAKGYFVGQDDSSSLSGDSLKFNFQNNCIYLPKPKLHINSVIASLITSVLLKKDLPINASDWEQALKTASMPGRLQVIKSQYSTLLDVSHNPQGTRHLAEFIRNFKPKNKVYAVFSALSDKDIPELIGSLINSVDFWMPALLAGKRASSKEELLKAFGLYGLSPTCYNNPLLAYEAAIAKAKPDDLIVVYGSFYTVASVLPNIEGQTQECAVDKIPL
ncbi:MAG: bifunctional tetrahydrofolate synthase/dihydrofolate synthase [Tatlockia sp.]|nr:bifunctional tetrahydrofolate synthase/dihydrofolate synthase [Tatlockia sp.]